MDIYTNFKFKQTQAITPSPSPTLVKNTVSSPTNTTLRYIAIQSHKMRNGYTVYYIHHSPPQMKRI